MQILLTRSADDSIQTAKALKRRRIESNIIPFLKIKRISHKKIELSSKDILIFTSRNGARFFSHGKNKKIRVFSVGPGTKKILQNLGFENIINTKGNINLLKNKISNYLEENARIFHPTFKDDNNDLKVYFRNLKCQYHAIKCYSSEMETVCFQKIKEFLDKPDNKIITFFSSFTARSFISQMKKYDLASCCKKKKFIVISDNVKNELNKASYNYVLTASEPNEEKMIQLIEKQFNKDRKYV